MNKNVVLKFGGTSLSTPQSMVLVKKIIKSTPLVAAIVVSAPGKSKKYPMKVTDALISASENKIEFDKYISYTKEVFKNIIDGLELTFDLDKEFNKIIKNYRRNKNPSYLISRGEYLSAKILSAYLNIKFIDSKYVIKFAKSGKLSYKTNKKIQNIVKKHKTIIIPGFYGSNKFGKIKIMKRGGSDITGSIVASAIKNSSYYNYTDVDGLLNYSPGISDKTDIISYISVDKMRFLCFYGANVLHYKCMSINHGRVIIKNTFNSKASGTIISDKQDNCENAITYTFGYQITIKIARKEQQKIFKKIKFEKLYEFSRLDDKFIGVRFDRENEKQKAIKLFNSLNINIIEIIVYGIIGKLKNNEHELIKENDQSILKFTYDNKTNIVFKNKK